MSGLVVGKNKPNRRGRPKKNILQIIQQNHSHGHGQNQVENLYNSKITKPLTIVRVAKRASAPIVKQEPVQDIVSGNIFALRERDTADSDDTTTYTESMEDLPSTTTAIDTQFNDIYTSLNNKNPLSFESSDLSSEDEIYDNLTSPSPIAVNHNSGVSHSQGVNLAQLPEVRYTSLKNDNNKNDDCSDDEESVYQQQQQIQEEQLLIQHYQTLQQQHYAQGISSTVFNNKDIIRASRIFKRPENHYIHYIEPSEADLYDSVEYDMDEQDKCWLQIYNKERRKEFLGDISPYLFECVMDKLEKEWFKMLKNAPKPEEKDVPVFSEDSACAVCDDTEVENSNAIVFCDGCNVAVHQDCYGIPYIPEGQWLCRKCMISPEFPVSCIFCPNEGGAFKQTNTNQWAHLLCAIWIPEVGVSNAVYMEPIDMIENIPKSRWKLTCSICRKKQGACIQCDNKNCFSAFHVTCAKSAGLCLRMNSSPSQSEGVVLNAYCDKHTPKDYQRTTPNHDIKRGRDRKRRQDETKSQQHFDAKDSKVARAHQHQYSTGVPIASDIILAKIDDLPSVRFSSIRKRHQLVEDIAHYWSLKRESRRGAPLLRRLHLEPWTAASKHKGDGTELFVRKSVVSQLRTDLEKVRILSEQVQKRERQKLERIKKQKDYLEMILFPLEYTIRPILDQFMEIDRKKLFYTASHGAVTSFTDIQQKLAHHQYLTLDQFENDIQQIWQHCLISGPSDASRYKVANKLQKASKKLFATAESKMERFELLPDNTWNEPVDPAIFDHNGNESDSAEDHDNSLEQAHKQLEQEKLQEKLMQEKEKERQREIQARIDGHARARVMHIQNKLKGDQTTSSKIMQKLRNSNISDKPPVIENLSIEPMTIDTHSLPYYEETFDKQVADLEVQHPILESYTSEFFDEPLILSTNNENELTINNFDQFFQFHQPFVQRVEEPSVVNTQIKEEEKPPISVNNKQDIIAKTPKKRPRSNSTHSARRLTRSAGLQASIEELTKRPKISHEARMLFASYNGVSHLDRPVETYKENRKRHAPIGWVYLDDDDKDSDEEENEEEEEDDVEHKRKHARQSRNGIPVPNFQRGEIVWARVDRYPSHPAKFLNYTDEEAGPKLTASRRYAGDILVEFLRVPEMHKYGWVGRRTICEIGDPKVDKARLAEALQKRPKRNVFIEEAKEGYRCAGSILGLDPEPIINNVFNSSIPKKKKKHSYKT